MTSKLKTMVREGETRRDWRWQAVREKNKSFDGLFYFGVQTTGIFCRPSCSSRTPKRANVSFFVSTADAQAAGYRACLRCKPLETTFRGKNADLIERALKLLRDGDREIASIDDLCTELGVS
jgi:methylphosphotriester-DNA--protein-cysteine methyltransferase